MKKSILLASIIALAGLMAACAPDPGSGGGTPSNAAPIAVIDPSTTSGGAPLNVVFDASDSVDADGTIVKYEWDFGDGTTGLGDVVTHDFAEGVWRTQLVVTDNGGKIGTAFVDITVTNLAPIAQIVASATSGAAPLTVTLDGSTSYDPDGTIASYAWTITDGAGASTSSITRTLAAGTYVATLTVTDQAGKTATASATITVTGTPAVPTGLQLTGSDCCDTWGDFAWNPVPGATAYEIRMNAPSVTDVFLNCRTNHGAVLEGQRSSGRVQAFGLCLGSYYDVSIRAQANGVWGPWSSQVRFRL